MKETKKLFCNICDKQFIQKKSFEKHVLKCKQQNTENHKTCWCVQKYECPFCNVTFLNSHLWRTHARTHISLFCCMLCEEAFPDREQCKIHYYTHQSFSQNDCGKAESQINNLSKTNQWNDLKIENELGLSSSDTTDIKIENGLQHDDDVFNIEIDPNALIFTDNSVHLKLEDDVAEHPLVDVFHEDDRMDNLADNDEDDFFDDLSVDQFKPKPMQRNKPIMCGLCNKHVDDAFWTDEEKLVHMNKNNACTCRICYRHYPSIELLKIHEETHFNGGKGEVWMACSNCLAKTICTRFPKRNLATTPKNPCPICSKPHTSVKNMRRHTRLHLDRTLYFCNRCPRIITGRMKYLFHEKTHTNPKIRIKGRFECDHCQKVCSTRESMITHLRQHLIVERFQCPYCPVSLKYETAIKDHIKSHDPSTYKLTCEVCGESFRSTHTLKRHIYSKHNNEFPFKCNVCSAAFKFQHRLKAHMGVHSDYQPYNCNICGKKYKSKTDLKKHEQRIHIGVEKKFTCEICDKRYYEKKFLRSHMFSSHKIIL